MVALVVGVFIGDALRADNLPVHVAHQSGLTWSAGTDTTGSAQADSTMENFKKEKLIAAVLAFPVPFGFSGLHRIYLGSEPWVPVAYLLTGGGGCGLLPLIDFIFIVSASPEELASYENNPGFFMWIK